MACVDVVLFKENADKSNELLLIKRKNEPFKGLWALPGGFIEMEEDLEDAAKRELAEETGIIVQSLLQIGAFGKPGRDPRGRSISIVFAGKFPPDSPPPKGADDAQEAAFFKSEQLPQLAFDHDLIIQKALTTLHKNPES
jgi:8-oxo-dGTP diphosphatase